ncbi:EF-hand calcium-binding domain-containing protein 7 [Zonotrichia leucophrys gambelii]|uniref:EF-hand calcium-binding domain-containing protein 7 n=1 Tax=Zonotrichia leucophrys gambelii TaxID=257770 RepID=UPI003140AB17
MASTPGNQKSTLSGNSQGKKSQHAEEAIFYMNCRAAYLAVLKSSLENIKSKEQLSLVLQQAGRNPSQKTINKYWTSQTSSLNFDDFCAILKKEKPATKTELLEAFGKIDTDKAGYISHDELCKILTTRGDRMTWEEVTSITKQADFNCNGKLDYNKFCELYLSTREWCCKAARARLESNPLLRQQHLGNQTGTVPEGVTLPSPKKPHKLPKGDSRAPSRPSSAQSSKASSSTTVTVAASSSRDTKLIIEPDTMKEWQCAQSRGCFYLEENGEIISHKYRLHLPQSSALCVTIKPFRIPQAQGKPCPWLSVDTALFILKENETQENLQLVSFTELQNKEMFGWRGELGAGVYWLLPFTTGCRLRKGKTQISGEAKLVWRDEDGELALTKEFRAALLDVFETIDLDGNGLLSLEEYNFFELRTSGEKCDQEAWAVCKENFEMKKNELTRQGFLDLNLMEANDRDGDPWDLWVTLLSLGYNRALEMTEACPFVVDVCAERCKPRMRAIALEAGGAQLSRALCSSVLTTGEAQGLGASGSIFIHTCSSGSRITSVIENKSENKVIIHVNNEQSKNCLNNRGLTVFAVEVAPKSMMVSQHVMALNEQEEWIYSCVHSLVC